MCVCVCANKVYLFFHMLFQVTYFCPTPVRSLYKSLSLDKSCIKPEKKKCDAARTNRRLRSHYVISFLTLP